MTTESTLAMRNRVFPILLAAALTAILLYYALRNVNLATLGRVLSAANYGYVAPFLFALALLYWIKALRWAMILAPLGKYTVWQVTPPMMIGFAANNVLPAHFGEIVRSAWFARRYGQRISAVLVSQVLERILDVVAILLIFLGAVPWIESTPPAIRISVWLAGGFASIVCVGIYAVLAAPQRVIHLWNVLSVKLPKSIRSQGESVLKDVLRALSSVHPPARLFVLLVNSVIQWSLMGACVWLSMAAMDVSIKPAIAIVVLTATVVAITLPSAPGYVGALQASFLFALEPFGVPSEAAVAGSIFFMVGNWIPVTAVGAIFALATRVNSSESSKH